MSEPILGRFQWDGFQLVYDEYGSGPRVVVLLHGLCVSRRMHAPLARELAGRGYRVVTPDLLGHGESDRPRSTSDYSMTQYAEQVIALLDSLGVDQAVVLGTSLGANTALEVADLAPERVLGMVVEMPVLENALSACASLFTPLLVGSKLAWPLVQLSNIVFSRMPRGWGWATDIAFDTLSQDPGALSAVLEGLFFGRIAPPRSRRRLMRTPALVLGHPRDPIHPFSDADMLVHELPNARLVQASSMVELRVTPQRLTGEIARFVDECWNAEHGDDVTPLHGRRTRRRARGA